MSVTKKIALYDLVELVEPVDGAEAGERGVVVEMLDNGAVMVELKTPAVELDLDRIIVAPLDRLRVIVAAHR